MKVVFIGSGNLATRLAIELYKYSFSIIQVYSRTLENAKRLADKVGSIPVDNISEIDSTADLYIFSVKDSALNDILDQMPHSNGMWVHTAGSLSWDVFSGYNENVGVVYPFQTFSKDREVTFENIPLFIESNNQKNTAYLKDIFSQISSKVYELSSEKRKQLHLTGVFACNFVNHLYAISYDILAAENIPFDSILPLIDETASKVHQMSPKEAQTGPAVRFDKNIIDYHLSLISDSRLKEIYKLMSEDIYQTNKK